MSEIRRRVRDLPLERQVEMLSGRDFWSTVEVAEIGVRSFVLTDGPHGVRRQPDGADHLGLGDSLPATCFPTASCLGSTWDTALIEEVGAALGREARTQGVGVLLGPGLNIKRHPAGGRNFEYFSEDPVVSGRLAAAMTRGVQSEGVGACLKHFVANNHESYRMVCDVIVDERTLREIYLRGFEIAVRDGRPWAVMTSYNLVNGDYVSDSTFLVQDVLRDDWGFDGLVVTDWGGVNDRVASVRAGVDLEMPSSGGAHDDTVIDAVESGDLDRALVVDRAVAVAELSGRIAGWSAPAGDEHEPGAFDEVGHHRLARRAAAAGTVLLRNDGILPIAAETDVAVIGAFADEPRVQGAGSSHVVPTRLDTARRMLEQRLRGTVRYASGYDPVTGRSDPAIVAEAARAARRSDVAVVFVGLPAIHEAEGYDRTTLALPPAHDELVRAVCAANPRTVVVLCNGAPVLMPWADRPAAIVEAYLGGQAGGAAVTDVIVGDAEPGGRLAETFPNSMRFPADENVGGGRQVQYREGHYIGYRFHTSAGVEPAFPFGHGMSYTTFEWSDAALVPEENGVTVSVTVTNTGDRPGSDVVQVYLRHDDSVVDRPARELRSFAKVHLDPGEATLVSLPLPRRDFAHWDTSSARWIVDGGAVTVLVAASSDDIRFELPTDVEPDVREPTSGNTSVVAQRGPRAPRFVATTAEFEAMLGHPVPEPTPVLPFTLNTVIDELDATRLGRIARSGFLKIAERQMASKLGDDPDPVLVELGSRMIREAPLRFLVSMSGGAGSVTAFEGLTTLLSALRITGRGRSGRDARDGEDDADTSMTGPDDP